MSESVRARYTLEFKQEAVRLVLGGQSISSAARSLGISDHTVHNWLKAEASGRLREAIGKPVNAEQMKIARLKAELARTRMERDILKKGAVTAFWSCGGSGCGASGGPIIKRMREISYSR